MIVEISKIMTKRVKDWIKLLHEPGGQFEMIIRNICGESPEFIDYQKRWYRRILETFGALYGKNAEVIIARAPARVNLIGMLGTKWRGFIRHLSVGRGWDFRLDSAENPIREENDFRLPFYSLSQHRRCGWTRDESKQKGLACLLDETRLLRG